MILKSKTCGEPRRTIQNRKSKMVRIPSNVLVRADRVIKMKRGECRVASDKWIQTERKT
jgi:hypothetical protein